MRRNSMTEWLRASPKRSRSGSGHGLLRLGAGEFGQVLPPMFVWWRGFAARYVGGVVPAAPSTRDGPRSGHCASGRGRARFAGTDGADDAGRRIPDGDVLRALWQEMRRRWPPLAAAKTDLQCFLKGLNPGLEPGRPRAFQSGREPPRPRRAVRLSRHLHHAAVGAGAGAAPAARSGVARICRRSQPRQAAVAAAAGAARRRDLPVAAADGRRGEIFHPLRWTPQRGRAAAWRASPIWSRPAWSCACRRLARQPPAASAGDGDGRRRKPVGARAGRAARFPHGRHAGRRDAEPEARSRRCSPAPTALVLLRGRWVEIDRERLERTIAAIPRRRSSWRAREGLPFAEAMRMLAGAAVADAPGDVAAADWSQRDRRAMARGDAQTLRAPDGAAVDPGPALHGTLRPYQKVGVQWLHLLSGLGLGRLPRRRHGARQDDPGAGAAAGAAARDGGAARPSLLVGARPRCWPTGRRRSSASRPT